MKRLLFVLLFATSLFGSECYIKDAVKHRHNQELLQAIIERENGSNLTTKINQIGTELLKSGFILRLAIGQASKFSNTAMSRSSLANLGGVLHHYLQTVILRANKAQ